MTKIAIIGLGYWGQILFSKLKMIDNQCLVIKKGEDLKKYNLQEIEWVFIATPDETHYELVKKFLNFDINIFCEKPLTKSEKESKDLYNIAESRNVSIYVSDIENYKNHQIKIEKENYILRTKNSPNKKDILNRLAYHDFTYLYKFINNKKIKEINIIESKIGCLSFQIICQNENYNFKYNLNSDKKYHLFNNNNLNNNLDALSLMLNSVVEKKVDLKLNKEISLFSNRLIEKIQEQINILE